MSSRSETGASTMDRAPKLASRKLSSLEPGVRFRLLQSPDAVLLEVLAQGSGEQVSVRHVGERRKWSVPGRMIVFVEEQRP